MLLSLSLVEPAFAQDKPLRTLSVTGRGIENVQTTIAQVRLGVEVQGKTAKEVQQTVAQRSAAVVALLKSRNVERLETTGINLNPSYQDNNGKPQVTGYIGSNIVSFRIATERAGTILDEAVKAGASRIEGVSFVATDQALNTAQQQALREAVQDAQIQARAILAVLKFTQREIVGIQVNGANPPPPIFRAELANKVLSQADQAPTPVIGGEQEVQASVTLQISY